MTQRQADTAAPGDEQGAPRPIRFQRDMSISHREFLRSFARVARGMDWAVQGSDIRVGQGARRIEIHLAAEGQRAIALLRLARTDVHFAFFGHSQAQIDDFMARFERGFQRGGG